MSMGAAGRHAAWLLHRGHHAELRFFEAGAPQGIVSSIVHA